jgi:hypothetical protein
MCPLIVGEICAGEKPHVARQGSGAGCARPCGSGRRLRTEDISPCNDAAREGLAISVDETLLESAEVTRDGRSSDKRIRAEQELGQVHTVVMEIMDEGVVE